MLRDARTRWTPRVPALVVHRHSVRRSPFSGTMLNLIIPVIRNCRDLAIGSPRLNYQGALACHCRHGPVIQTKTGHSKTGAVRSEEHTSELQALMRISYAVFCLKKKQNNQTNKDTPSI